MKSHERLFIPGQETETRILRTAVLFEMWHTAADNLQVEFIVGLKPRNGSTRDQDWLELPGGGFSKESLSTVGIITEGIRELNEEVHIGHKPSRRPEVSLLGASNLAEAIPPITVEGRIDTYPIVIRAAFDGVPKLLVGPTNEFSALERIDVTRYYYPDVPGKVFQVPDSHKGTKFSQITSNVLKEFYDPTNKRPPLVLR